MDTKGLLELAKTAGRFLWFGFLALVVTVLTGLASDGQITGAHVSVAGQTVQVGFLLVIIIGFVVKALDRYIHSSQSTKLNGLAPAPLQRTE